jgi:lipid II:glycine glycyltransferase (peptidoglycan interpeptide bridge formation enzyme)
MVLDKKLEIINPLTISNWDELVLDTTKYSFFHSAAWARVLNLTYNYTPLYFCLTDNRKLKILIPFMIIKSWLTGTRAVSLPFTDYCPIILKNEFKHEDLIRDIIKYGKNEGWKSIELRHNRSNNSMVSPSDSFYEHYLDLKVNESDLYEKFRASTKRNIKKAKKYGVETRISTSLNSLNEYYHLHCITRKRQGSPPQPFSFFKNIFEHILKEENGFIVLATYKNVVISGMIFFCFGKEAIYKFGASSQKYQETRSNNLVMWEGIKYCLKKGCEQLSLGRTEENNPGLRQFKNGWAVNEIVINYYTYSLKEDRYLSDNNGMYDYMVKIFKKFPLSLLKLTGKIAYRHIG